MKLGLKGCATFIDVANPTTLSKQPNAIEHPIPDYNWEEQTRGNTIVGRYTSGSIQTYNSKGQPADSKADQDD
jgi:hypothetical protein